MTGGAGGWGGGGGKGVQHRPASKKQQISATVDFRTAAWGELSLHPSGKRLTLSFCFVYLFPLGDISRGTVVVITITGN